MAKKHHSDWLDIVERLKELSNISPEQERQQLLEAAKQEPRILDDKDVSLADIAKLAGIKEYTEPKVSKEAEKLIESIVNDQPTKESIITKAIKESDTDTSISTKIKKEVTEDSKRLDKIAELEAQLAELKAEQKNEQTHDAESFKKIISAEIEEYIKNADENQLSELYNSISDNEAVYNEEQKTILIKTAETKEIIADAEKNEEKVVQEIDNDKEIEEMEAEPAKCTHCDGTGKHGEDDCEVCGGSGIIREAGYEGQSDPHAHEITLAGDYNQENAVSDEDAMRIQSMLKKAGIDAEVHPSEQAHNKIHVHTMASKDAVLDVLGDGIDEQVSYKDELSENKK
jgi:hypothetical protein